MSYLIWEIFGAKKDFEDLGQQYKLLKKKALSLKHKIKSGSHTWEQ